MVQGKHSFLLTWNLVLLCVFCDVAGIVAIKWEINRLGEIPLASLSLIWDYFINLAITPLAVAGGFLFLAAPFFFAAALSRMDISTAYPVTVGLNMFGLIALSVLFLGESLSFYKITGMALITGSLFFLYE